MPIAPVLLDLLLAGGQVWDGTGAPVHTADVLVHDGKIAAVGVHLTVQEGTREPACGPEPTRSQPPSACILECSATIRS